MSHPSDPIILHLADRSILGSYEKHRRKDGSIDWMQAEPGIFEDGAKAFRSGECRDSGFADQFLAAAWLAGWDAEQDDRCHSE